MWRPLLAIVVWLPGLLQGAPLVLPQTISCSGEVYGLHNQTTSDRTAYLFVAVPSGDLQDCVNKCFGNQFCYSVKYDGTEADSCSLYYFAAYNCSNQELVSVKSIRYTGRPVTVDCLRCPDRGEFITAPPFNSFTEQTITAAPTAGAQSQSKPLIKEITHNIDSKLGNKTDKEGTTPVEEFNKDEETTTVQTAGETTPSAEQTTKGTTPTSSTSTGTTSFTDFSHDEKTAVVKTQPDSGIQRACVIKFQVDEKSDAANHEHYDVRRVRSINQCARMCYAGFCSTAVYSSEKGECRLGKSVRERCTLGLEHLSRYQARGDVLLQCFRCSPQKTEATKVPTMTAESTTSEVAHSDDEPEQQVIHDHTVEAESTTVSTFPMTEPSQPERKHCVIKFQARPLDQRPAELHAPFELELPVDSVELCATRCYQDGCSGAKYDPSQGTCTLSYDDKHYCVRGPVVVNYNATGLTWVHCVNCYTVKAHSNAMSPAVMAMMVTAKPESTTAAAEEAPTSTLSVQGMQPDDEGSLLLHGCVVNFQIVEFSARPDHFKAVTERNISTPTAEICAHGCYQDGCSGAKYDPSTKLCELSYDDKPFCTNGKQLAIAKPTSTVWMHCFSCIPRTPGKEGFEVVGKGKEEKSSEIPAQGSETTPAAGKNEGHGETTAALEKEGGKKEIGKPEGKRSSSDCVIKFQARPLKDRPSDLHATFELELPVDSVELCATRCYQDGCSGAKYDPKEGTCTLSYDDKQFCAKEPVTVHYNASNLTWVHCVNCYSVKGGKSNAMPMSDGSTPAPSTTAKPAVGGNGGEFLHGCVVNFQMVDFEKRSDHFKAPLERTFKASTAEICAHGCYQDGCSGAKYDPTTKQCQLSYDDRPYCTNNKQLAVARPDSAVWMHCFSCIPRVPGKDGFEIVKGDGKDDMLKFAGNEDEEPKVMEGSGAEAMPPAEGTTPGETIPTAEGPTEAPAEKITVAVVGGDQAESATTAIVEGGAASSEGPTSEESTIETSTKEAATPAEGTTVGGVMSSSPGEASSTRVLAEGESTTAAPSLGEEVLIPKDQTTVGTPVTTAETVTEGSGEEPKGENELAASKDETPSTTEKAEVVVTTAEGASSTAEVTTTAPEETTSAETAATKLIIAADLPNHQGTVQVVIETTPAPSTEAGETTTAASGEATTASETSSPSVTVFVVPVEGGPNATTSVIELTAATSETTVSSVSTTGGEASEVTTVVPVEGSGEEITTAPKTENELAASQDEKATTTAKPDEATTAETAHIVIVDSDKTGATTTPSPASPGNARQFPATEGSTVAAETTSSEPTMKDNGETEATTAVSVSETTLLTSEETTTVIVESSTEVTTAAPTDETAASKEDASTVGVVVAELSTPASTTEGTTSAVAETASEATTTANEVEGSGEALPATTVTAVESTTENNEVPAKVVAANVDEGAATTRKPDETTEAVNTAAGETTTEAVITVAGATFVPVTATSEVPSSTEATSVAVQESTTEGKPDGTTGAVIVAEGSGDEATTEATASVVTLGKEEGASATTEATTAAGIPEVKGATVAGVITEETTTSAAQTTTVTGTPAEATTAVSETPANVIVAGQVEGAQSTTAEPTEGTTAGEGATESTTPAEGTTVGGVMSSSPGEASSTRVLAEGESTTAAPSLGEEVLIPKDQTTVGTPVTTAETVTEGSGEEPKGENELAASKDETPSTTEKAEVVVTTAEGASSTAEVTTTAPEETTSAETAATKLIIAADLPNHQGTVQVVIETTPAPSTEAGETTTAASGEATTASETSSPSVTVFVVPVEGGPNATTSVIELTAATSETTVSSVSTTGGEASEVTTVVPVEGSGEEASTPTTERVLPAVHDLTSSTTVVPAETSETTAATEAAALPSSSTEVFSSPETAVAGVLSTTTAETATAASESTVSPAVPVVVEGRGGESTDSIGENELAASHDKEGTTTVKPDETTAVASEETPTPEGTTVSTPEEPTTAGQESTPAEGIIVSSKAPVAEGVAEQTTSAPTSPETLPESTTAVEATALAENATVKAEEGSAGVAVGPKSTAQPESTTNSDVPTASSTRTSEATTASGGVAVPGVVDESTTSPNAETPASETAPVIEGSGEVVETATVIVESNIGDHATAAPEGTSVAVVSGESTTTNAATAVAEGSGEEETTTFVVVETTAESNELATNKDGRLLTTENAEKKPDSTTANETTLEATTAPGATIVAGEALLVTTDTFDASETTTVIAESTEAPATTVKAEDATTAESEAPVKVTAAGQVEGAPSTTTEPTEATAVEEAATTTNAESTTPAEGTTVGGVMSSSPGEASSTRVLAEGESTTAAPSLGEEVLIPKDQTTVGTPVTTAETVTEGSGEEPKGENELAASKDETPSTTEKAEVVVTTAEGASSTAEVTTTAPEETTSAETAATKLIIAADLPNHQGTVQVVIETTPAPSTEAGETTTAASGEATTASETSSPSVTVFVVPVEGGPNATTSVIELTAATSETTVSSVSTTGGEASEVTTVVPVEGSGEEITTAPKTENELAASQDEKATTTAKPDEATTAETAHIVIVDSDKTGATTTPSPASPGNARQFPATEGSTVAAETTSSEPTMKDNGETEATTAVSVSETTLLTSEETTTVIVESSTEVTTAAPTDETAASKEDASTVGVVVAELSTPASTTEGTTSAVAETASEATTTANEVEGSGEALPATTVTAVESTTENNEVPAKVVAANVDEGAATTRKPDETTEAVNTAAGETTTEAVITVAGATFVPVTATSEVPSSTEATSVAVQESTTEGKPDGTTGAVIVAEGSGDEATTEATASVVTLGKEEGASATTEATTAAGIPEVKGATVAGVITEETTTSAAQTTTVTGTPAEATTAVSETPANVIVAGQVEGAQSTTAEPTEGTTAGEGATESTTPAEGTTVGGVMSSSPGEASSTRVLAEGESTTAAPSLGEEVLIPKDQTTVGTPVTTAETVTEGSGEEPKGENELAASKDETPSTTEKAEVVVTTAEGASSTAEVTTTAPEETTSAETAATKLIIAADLPNHQGTVQVVIETTPAPSTEAGETTTAASGEATTASETSSPSVTVFVVPVEGGPNATTSVIELTAATSETTVSSVSTTGGEASEVTTVVPVEGSGEEASTPTTERVLPAVHDLTSSTTVVPAETSETTAATEAAALPSSSTEVFSSPETATTPSLEAVEGSGGILLTTVLPNEIPLEAVNVSNLEGASSTTAPAETSSAEQATAGSPIIGLVPAEAASGSSTAATETSSVIAEVSSPRGETETEATTAGNELAAANKDVPPSSTVKPNDITMEAFVTEGDATPEASTESTGAAAVVGGVVLGTTSTTPLAEVTTVTTAEGQTSAPGVGSTTVTEIEGSGEVMLTTTEAVIVPVIVGKEGATTEKVETSTAPIVEGESSTVNTEETTESVTVKGSTGVPETSTGVAITEAAPKANATTVEGSGEGFINDNGDLHTPDGGEMRTFTSADEKRREEEEAEASTTAAPEFEVNTTMAAFVTDNGEGEESKTTLIPVVVSGGEQKTTTEGPATAESSTAAETKTTEDFAAQQDASTQTSVSDESTESLKDTTIFSESVITTTTGQSTDITILEAPSDDDELINATLFKQEHNGKLPTSVGFVPGSDPGDTQLDKDLQEEDEEPETKEPAKSDYEDTVKNLNETAATPSNETATTATVEPPVQMVQDIIDALAAGGLASVLGPNKRPTAAAKDLIAKKLGSLSKFVPMKSKADCTDGRVHFVAREFQDLSHHFEADALAYSLEHCARICYETGCSQAAYTRFPRPVCLMNYGNSTNCPDREGFEDGYAFSKIQEVVELRCFKCDKPEKKEEEKMKKPDQAIGFSIDEPTEREAQQGVSKKCSGRLEFHVMPVGSLPRLNVTNDVPAKTPADCAKKCFESEGCTTAGFIPSPNSAISSGVCLLTTDEKVCANNGDFVPQHASLTPFVLSCMRCSSCTYQLRPVNPTQPPSKWDHHESVETVGKCASACHERRCTLAQYDSNLHTCSMTSAPRTRQCSGETAVVAEGTLPVTLECVSCQE